MSKEGWSNISIDADTSEMLNLIARDVESETEVKLTPHQTIKMLCKQKLAAKEQAVTE